MLTGAWHRAKYALSAGAAAAVVASVLVGGPRAALAQDKTPILNRKFIYAPWNPADLPEVRKKYGLIGPGAKSAYPKPTFPRGLTKPDNIERLMPNARAVVRQSGGRSPLGLTIPGDVVLLVALYNAEPMVQEAVIRAYKERGIEARVLYEHDVIGVTKADLQAIDDADDFFDATDSQQEFRAWFFRSIADVEKAKAWFKAQDEELYNVTFPKLKPLDPRLKELADKLEGMVGRDLVKYLDAHPEVTKVFWRGGGRTRTRTFLKHHGEKFYGNYLYNDFFDLMSEVPAFPGDVWRLLETKTIEPLRFVDRGEASDPEGTVLAWDLNERQAQAWANGVYQQGHLYMFPSQATGRWPYSMVEYPAYGKTYIDAELVESVNGVVAATNDHISTHPRMAIEITKGRISNVTGGGYYGELMRIAQKYPGIQDRTFPEYQQPGYWWLYEAGTGTNPKYFKHPGELLRGTNHSERNVAGVIHWSFGAYAQHGPEKRGEVSPKRIAFGKETNLPIDHCCHNHTLLPTFQVRIRELDQWITLIEHGRLNSFNDLQVRALAARYGNPDKILTHTYIPPLPGINVAGDYNTYGKNPGQYWIDWSKKILDGSSPYLND
jgi:hypothetical protein